MTSWYFSLAKSTVDDFLVVAVLAHLLEPVGSFKICVAYNAFLHIDLTRYNIMRLFALAYHLQVDLLAHSDFPFEWNVSEPFFRFVLGHGVDPAKLVAKPNSFIPELKY